jgi:hypothetical protein
MPVANSRFAEAHALRIGVSRGPGRVIQPSTSTAATDTPTDSPRAARVRAESKECQSRSRLLKPMSRR